MEKYDRTNIFEHAEVRYTKDTKILPRNFESALRQSNDNVKIQYTKLKNALMKYSGVNSRMLKYDEVFRANGVIAKLRIKGKNLYAYLKIDSATVDQDWLKTVDQSHRNRYVEVPCEIKVTGKRKAKRTIELIDLMCEALQLGYKRNFKEIDYVEVYPYEENAVIKGKNMVLVE